MMFYTLSDQFLFFQIDKNIQHHWSQYGPQQNPTCHWCPFGYQAFDHYPLDMTIQSIPHPPNSPPIKSVSLQFREKDVMGDHVKELTEVQRDDIRSSSLVH